MSEHNKNSKSIENLVRVFSKQNPGDQAEGLKETRKSRVWLFDTLNWDLELMSIHEITNSYPLKGMSGGEIFRLHKALEGNKKPLPEGLNESMKLDLFMKLINRHKENHTYIDLEKLNDVYQQLETIQPR